MFELSGHRPSYPVFGPHKRFNQFNTYLKSIHYDHVEIIFSGLRVIQSMFDLLMLHVATWFKETAVLFNVHLSCFVDFILYATDNC